MNLAWPKIAWMKEVYSRHTAVVLAALGNTLQPNGCINLLFLPGSCNGCRVWERHSLLKELTSPRYMCCWKKLLGHVLVGWLKQNKHKNLLCQSTSWKVPAGILVAGACWCHMQPSYAPHLPCHHKAHPDQCCPQLSGAWKIPCTNKHTQPHNIESLSQYSTGWGSLEREWLKEDAGVDTGTLWAGVAGVAGVPNVSTWARSSSVCLSSASSFLTISKTFFSSSLTSFSSWSSSAASSSCPSFLSTLAFSCFTLSSSSSLAFSCLTLSSSSSLAFSSLAFSFCLARSSSLLTSFSSSSSLAFSSLAFSFCLARSSSLLTSFSSSSSLAFSCLTLSSSSSLAFSCFTLSSSCWSLLSSLFSSSSLAFSFLLLSSSSSLACFSFSSLAVWSSIPCFLLASSWSLILSFSSSCCLLLARSCFLCCICAWKFFSCICFSALAFLSKSSCLIFCNSSGLWLCAGCGAGLASSAGAGVAPARFLAICGMVFANPV